MNGGSRTKTNVTYLRKRQPAILVVEQQILTRSAIAQSLRDWGFKVYEAGNSEDAVTLIESGKIDVDFVLVDLDMRGPFDGVRLTLWLREHAPRVVALLASADKHRVTLADSYGAPFITKPYDTRKVLVIIRNAMPRRP
jgi:two-component system torCAD operon response regulator TorR